MGGKKRDEGPKTRWTSEIVKDIQDLTLNTGRKSKEFERVANNIEPMGLLSS